jgi:hypothetical protein
MTRFTCAVLGGIAASTLSIVAQTQSGPPATAAPGSTITVTGCVENAVADGSIGGTPLGTSATPANYALEGNRDELAAHKGHRVEITGTLAPPASSGANAPASRDFQTGVQRLRVQTLKMTAESCK